MPKSKKRKTNHQSTAHGRNGELSHEEIWDDSALIRAWNDAYAEYEYYHSIHARGEDVEEVLRRAEAEAEVEVEVEQSTTANNTSASNHPNNDEVDMEPEDGEIEDDDDAAMEDSSKNLLTMLMNDDEEEGSAIAMSTPPDQKSTPNKSEHEQPITNNKSATANPKPTFSNPTAPSKTSTSTIPEITNASLSSSAAAAAPISADQTLENLKMAYYWAGYYSGLYDGQKQNTDQSQAQQNQN